MIPKIIHYCWFGGNPLPEEALACIDSWKKFFPDYEIKRWDESNFDLNSCDYIKEAYQAKKWAFVSDYARFKILYENGGLYFDTDVEVLKPMDSIIAKGSFMGCEAGPATSVPVSSSDIGAEVASGLGLGANAGLGLGANAGLGLYKEILNYYESQHFLLEDGSINQENVVERVTGILRQHGFKGDGTIEKIEGVTIYPPEYFCPFNFYTGVTNITDNTYTIHHYTASWFTKAEKKINEINRKYIQLGKRDSLQRKIEQFPFWLWHRIELVTKKGK